MNDITFISFGFIVGMLFANYVDVRNAEKGIFMPLWGDDYVVCRKVDVESND